MLPCQFNLPSGCLGALWGKRANQLLLIQKKYQQVRKGIQESILVQFSCSVVSDSCKPMNHSMPGLFVHHQFPEFTQTHVHRVGDAIQPSHPPPPLLVPFSSCPQSLPASGSFPMSLFFAKVLEFQLQHQSFQ